MKVDILVIAAHPDDAELGCGGTILTHIAQGYKVGVIDLTQGELGTRGTAEIRLMESEEASRRLGLSVRENLHFRDAFFRNDEAHQLKIIEMVRKYRPDIVLANALFDRHPDHGRASALISEACFYSGLRRITSTEGGTVQDTWRPKVVYHFIQDRYIKPDLVVDISAYMDQKLQVLSAFKSQFHDPASKEPQTVLTSPHFMDGVRARAREYGKDISAEYGEGFTAERMIGVKDLFSLM